MALGGLQAEAVPLAAFVDIFYLQSGGFEKCSEKSALNSLKYP